MRRYGFENDIFKIPVAQCDSKRLPDTIIITESSFQYFQILFLVFEIIWSFILLPKHNIKDMINPFEF